MRILNGGVAVVFNRCGLASSQYHKEVGQESKQVRHGQPSTQNEADAELLSRGKCGVVTDEFGIFITLPCLRCS